MYSRSTGEVNSNRVTSSLRRKWTRLPTHAHEVRPLTFEVTDNFGSNDTLPCGAYGPRPVSILPSFHPVASLPVSPNALLPLSLYVCWPIQLLSFRHLSSRRQGHGLERLVTQVNLSTGPVMDDAFNHPGRSVSETTLLLLLLRSLS